MPTVSAHIWPSPLCVSSRTPGRERVGVLAPPWGQVGGAGRHTVVPDPAASLQER